MVRGIVSGRVDWCYEGMLNDVFKGWVTVICYLLALPCPKDATSITLLPNLEIADSSVDAGDDRTSITGGNGSACSTPVGEVVVVRGVTNASSSKGNASGALLLFLLLFLSSLLLSLLLLVIAVGSVGLSCHKS